MTRSGLHHHRSWVLALALTTCAWLLPPVAGGLVAHADSHNTRSLNTQYDEPVHHYDTEHIRVHYTISGEHATDAGYAGMVGDTFEEVRTEQVAVMGWPHPADDGDLGGDGRTDVYLRDRDTLPANAHAMVDKFPDGEGGYEEDCDQYRCHDVSGYIRMTTDLNDYMTLVIAAHELTHLYQFAAAYHVEGWMKEATAMWMEGEILPDRLPSYRPIDVWAAHPEVPLAQVDNYALRYASWVWDRWVAHRHGQGAVRDAWIEALDAQQEGLGGYVAALSSRGTSFSEEFLEFTAATAAWRHDFPWYGFSESFRRDHWPDDWEVRREGKVTTGAGGTVMLDHTSYALFDVETSGGARLSATASEDIAGGVALVIDRGMSDVTRVTAPFEGGSATVTVDERTDEAVLTAVIVNADPTVAQPFDPDDPGPVEYAHDDVAIAFEIEHVEVAEEAPEVPDRIGGLDRFETAADISEAFFDPGVDRVYIATGLDFPDALTGGAAGIGSPLLLATRDTLPDDTRAELQRLQPGEIVILGGPVAIGDDVESELAGYTDGDVRRLAGHNRFATAAQISADRFEPDQTDHALVATGADFADALAGTPWAGLEQAPILLVASDTVPQETRDELDRLGLQRITVLGGPVAVSDQVEAQLADHADDVQRVAGADRFATSVEVAEAVRGLLGDDRSDPVYVATGLAFADALAGGAAIGSVTGPGTGPLLLAARDVVPDTVRGHLQVNDNASLTVFGGPAAISHDTEQQLRDAAGVN